MTVAQALNGEPILFRRWLYQELRVQWEVIWEDANNFQLEDSADVVFWNLGKNGKFSVKSVYDGLTKNDCGFSIKESGKEKFQLKLKFFCGLCLVEQY
jgi:hypothetical protein